MTREGLPKNYESPLRKTEEAMVSLLSQLKPEIEKGEYTAIIGEDTSGRLPTLIIKGVVDEIYRRQNRKIIPTLIVPTGQLVKPETRRQAAQKALDFLAGRKGKILVVTESVETGISVGKLGKLITENGFTFDIATMYMAEEKDEYYDETHLFPLPKETKIFNGTRDVSVMKAIYNKPELTGMMPAQFGTRDLPKEIKVDMNRILVQPLRNMDRAELLEARDEARRISDEILRRVF